MGVLFKNKSSNPVPAGKSAAAQQDPVEPEDNEQEGLFNGEEAKEEEVEDEEAEEEDHTEEDLAHAPIPQRSPKPCPSETREGAKSSPKAAPPSPSRKSDTAQVDLVQVTAKIPRELHARMRIQSFRTGLSNIELISSWIEQNCPE